MDINNCNNIDILREEAVRLRMIVDTIMQKRQKARHDYYMKNADKIKSYNKEYNNKHPEKIAQNRRNWVNNNRERYITIQKKWYDNNREHLKEYQRAYRERKKLQKQAPISEAIF